MEALPICTGYATPEESNSRTGEIVEEDLKPNTSKEKVAQKPTLKISPKQERNEGFVLSLKEINEGLLERRD